MVRPLHLRAIQWKKEELIVFFRAVETSQLDVASCSPMKENAGIGCLGVFWFYCIQRSS